MTQVTYKDFDKNKTFEIKALRGFKAWSFTNLLLGMLAETDAITPETIRKLVAIKFGVQEDLSADEKEDINKLFEMDLMDMLFNVVKSALSGIDKAKEKEIMQVILSCVTFVNGALNIEVHLESKDPNQDINNILQNPLNYYKLIYDVLKETYSGLF